MTCDQCGKKMVMVGREIKPGDSRVWRDSYLCPTTRCPGYGMYSHDKTEVRWPALTLMDVAGAAFIRGAMRFRDSRG